MSETRTAHMGSLDGARELEIVRPGRAGQRAKRRGTRIGRPERIATARVIPKRGTVTPIELRFRNKNALENNR